MENEKPCCEKCKKLLVPGKAIASVCGNANENYSNGATMYPIGGALVDVMKCPSCGYSQHFLGKTIYAFDKNLKVD